MLLLTATTDKLQVITDAAATVDVHASWVDVSGTTVTPGRTNTAITTAATTDVVASPAASTQRNIKTLHIRNRHATLPTSITVQFNQNATLFELHKTTLNPGDGLEYVEGVGFFLLAVLQPASKVLSADQSNSTTTPTEVTGLTIPLGVGTWAFRYDVLYQTTNTGTGVKYSVDFTGTVTAFVANRMFGDVSAAAATAGADQDQVLATAAVLSVFTARAKSQAGWGVTITADTANADMYEIIEGLLVVSVAGNLALWHGSETAVQTITRAGSKVRVG